jgi:DNA-binding transcriptional ArsR family regulator
MRVDALAAEQPGTDAMLRALSEPRRREILRLVAESELSAGAIAAEFDVTRTAISQHLTVLRTAGLVTERREGTRRLYRGRRAALREVQTALEGLWSSSLDRGKALVEGSR